MKLNKYDLPENVTQFVRNLDGALGDRLIGAVLFGSYARNEAGEESDIDLAVIVADADGEHSRQEVFRVLGLSGVDPKEVSLSVETYMRLKDFLRRGDPFAWVVCREGVILRERNELLTDIQKQCQSSEEGLDVSMVAGYLQNKSVTHYTQAMQAFQQFLSNIQLSTMAGAQAVAVQQAKGKIKETKLVPMADWEHLKGMLQQTSATKREIEALQQLIEAHKQARKDGAEFVGRELMETIRVAGELWKRLLAPDRKGK
jgi:predicted nucleotidyltransferase